MLVGLWPWHAVTGVHTHHASLPERVAYVEQLLGESADKHAMEIAALKEQHTKIYSAHSKNDKDSARLALHRSGDSAPFWTLDFRLSVDQGLG